MSRRFVRPVHQNVIAVLGGLDRVALERTGCFFGGGTRIVLELGEYRESQDIDFLCADGVGYRALRESISESSLGLIARKSTKLAREVRADQYGVRTRIGDGASALKFEIVRESRIPLASAAIEGIPVPCLDRVSCFAEKFLANADRGLDRSTHSRDLIDLAFMLESWPGDAAEGYRMACGAYGKSVPRLVTQAQALFAESRYRSSCVNALAITETTKLARGLKKLGKFIDAASAGS